MAPVSSQRTRWGTVGLRVSLVEPVGTAAVRSQRLHPFPPHPAKRENRKRREGREVVPGGRRRAPHHLQVMGLQRMTFAAEDVRAAVGTDARQASIRTPNPGPSTAMGHLGTGQACCQGKVAKGSLEVGGTRAAGLACLGCRLVLGLERRK